MIKLLKNKNAVILWLSRAFSRFGDAVESLALMYLVYDLTGSGIAMGTVMLFSMIPMIIIGPIAGVIVDRYNKKAIMFIAEMVRTIFILAIPILMYYHVLNIWHIYAVALVVSVAESFFEPCAGIAFTLVVSKEELPTLNSISSSTNSVMRIIGYSIAGIAIVTVGKEILFIVDAVTFFVSGIAALIMVIPKIERKKADKKATIISEFINGAKYTFSNKLVLTLLLGIVVINGLGTPLTEFVPMITEKILYVDPKWAGYFLTTLSICSIIGALIYPFLLKMKITLNQVYLMAFILIALSTYSICLIPSKITGIIFFLILGIISPIISSWSFTEIQLNTEKEYLGRMIAFSNVALMSSIPLVAAISGVIMDMFSYSILLKIIATLFILSSFIINSIMKKNLVKTKNAASA